jgi:hypothetical protein
MAMVGSSCSGYTSCNGCSDVMDQLPEVVVSAITSAFTSGKKALLEGPGECQGPAGTTGMETRELPCW